MAEKDGKLGIWVESNNMKWLDKAVSTKLHKDTIESVDDDKVNVDTILESPNLLKVTSLKELSTSLWLTETLEMVDLRILMIELISKKESIGVPKIMYEDRARLIMDEF